MESSIKLLLKNTIYTFLSNAASFVINALVVLIIPKMIGVSDFGYYQLYMLLGTYALFFHFGWCDGIYLRYVGCDYKELDKELLSSQFKGIFLMSGGLLFLLSGAAALIFTEPNKLWVYVLAAVVVFIVTPKTYTSVVMQMTNRMKQYSQIILAEKAVYVVGLLVMLTVGIRDFKLLILADLLGKIAALALGIYFCRDIIFVRIDLIKISAYYGEMGKSLKVGIFLLLSNLASLMITGIVQFCVEFKWDIETFSKVSLTFNMSKMLLVVITAMSIVLVPALKHMKEDQLASMYRGIRSLLMFVLGAMLILYYPLKVILSLWLPQYTESLQFMALLFPMCLFESKTQLLINTYLKAMREERKLCFVNILTVAVSGGAAYITIFIMGNLNMAILSIPYLLALRCVMLEFYIGKKLGLHLMKDAVIEIFLATVFIAVSWFLDSWLATVFYVIAYGAYVLYIKSELIYAVKKVFAMLGCR